MAIETFTAATVPSTGDPYDLTAGGTRSPPISYSWPTQPYALTPVSASSVAAVNSAPSGSVVTLSPGTYSGNISLSNSDVSVILTGCTINGNVAVTPGTTRVRITGGRFNYTFEPTWHGSHVTLYNVAFIGQPGAYTQHVVYSGAHHYAFVYCTLNNINNNAGALFSTKGTTDFIWAACDVHAQSFWGLRVMGCDRTIMADCRFRMNSTSYANVRFHADDQDVNGFWAVGNQFNDAARIEVNSWGADGTVAGAITNAYLDSNRFYADQATSNVWINQNGLGGTAQVYLRNNTHYTNAGTGAMTYLLGGGGTVMENTNNVRAPYVTPPAWTGGSNQ